MLKEYFDHIVFAHKPALFLLLIIPILAGWYLSYSRAKRGTLLVSSMQSFKHTESIKNKLRYIPFVLRLICITFIILALARPQSFSDEENIEGEGIDIVLCLDVSGSMLAQDFKPNRLEAAKRVASEFIRNRPADRIGLVTFAGESFTQCPVTNNHIELENQLIRVDGSFLIDGTAIGSGLATSVDRLRASNATTKLVILLTDGEDNGGLIDPLTAKNIAKHYGVKVYTIGMGSSGYANTPVLGADGKVVMQQEKVTVDEHLLTQIAEETGGKYFRAKGDQSLSDVYAEIDEMEKTKFEVKTTRHYVEKFHLLVLIAIGVLILEIILRLTWLRQFP